MNIFRKIARIIIGSDKPPEDGPVMFIADEVDATIPGDGVGNSFQTVSVPGVIPQNTLPLGSVFFATFAQNAGPIAVLRVENDTPGQLDLFLYYQGPVIAGTYRLHFAGFRHAN